MSKKRGCNLCEIWFCDNLTLAKKNRMTPAEPLGFASSLAGPPSIRPCHLPMTMGCRIYPLAFVLSPVLEPASFVFFYHHFSMTADGVYVGAFVPALMLCIRSKSRCHGLAPPKQLGLPPFQPHSTSFEYFPSTSNRTCSPLGRPSDHARKIRCRPARI